jgi:diguanylate cyclase (GGDEF)-like protein/PAS domain S-box-containing protein
MKKKEPEDIDASCPGQPAPAGTSKRVYSEEEQSRFRAALDSSIDAIFLIDRQQMRFIDANETASTILGYSHEELLGLGPQHLKPDHGELELIHRRFDKIIQSESKSGIIRTVHQRKDGVRLPVEVYLRALPSEDRQILVAVVRDLTLQLQAEAQLRESEERFRVAFSQAAVGLAHVAPDGRWLMVNRKLCQILGYSQPELLGMTGREITHPDDLLAEENRARQHRNRALSEKSREKRYRHKDGHYIWVNFTSSPVRDADGQPKYYSVVVEDISRRKRVEDQLQHLANHDALTSLPNRSLLQDRLSQAVAYANRLGKSMAVMVIDLDRFKNLNDSLGHHAGDQILIEISRRLSSMLLDGDTVGRLGGDEFVFVLADSAEDDVTMLAQQTLEMVSQPMMIESHDFYPSCSIGISLYPKDGQDGQTLLKNADTAMYRAKEAGRNTFQFYASEMNARALDRLKLESGLRRALERGEFVLHYQPQVDLVSGRIVGLEALLRWQPPGQAMLPPDEFISIAEETGLIVQIGQWALRAACAQNLTWQAAGLPLLRMSVNLSARQFQQQDVVRMVSQALQQLDYPAQALTLEITESVVMENPEQAAATLQHLSDMGIHLSIDDFGTGYSSLNYLKRFPIHALKIDKSFVHDITTDTDDAAIAKAVIVLAHSMKLEVIAEGVETIEQLDFLRQQQCDQMQGYYFSRPLPADRIEALLRQEMQRGAAKN